MISSKEQLHSRIAVAAKRAPADLVIKNGKIIDVFSCEIYEADLAIKDGSFVGIGSYDGLEVLDAEGRFICPSFIDGHVHIESSMVRPSEFAKIVLPHGVTTIVTDPHEIGNVSGSEGIQFMLDDSEGLPLEVFFMLPSCVPTTPFENTGAALNAEKLAPLYEHERVLGLGEVMNFPAVFNGEEGMLNKLADAIQADKLIDGHAAGIDADGINVYTAANIRTDHECNTAEEALARIRRGMYVMIREGTASKDLKELITVVNDKNARRFLFVTDDKHLDELVEEGSIDYNVRLAIKLGLDPLLAIQMATLNAAECFRLENKGAIAPGYDANFLLLDSLEDVSISEVYKAGQLVAKAGVCLPFPAKEVEKHERVIQSMKLGDLGKDALQMKLEEAQEANIIEIIPNQIVTKHVVEKVTVKDGYFQPSIENDQLKLCVIERHNNTGNIGHAIVKGLGLTAGAIASTVAHDSHNLVVAGTNDDDMLTAIEKIRALGGGKAVVKSGQVLATIPLGLSGLMSVKGANDVLHELQSVNEALNEIGFQANFNPFSTLSFLSLPVIPHLKLTDMGLFDVNNFKLIQIGE